MKSSFCIDLQRFMLIPTKFPLNQHYHIHQGRAYQSLFINTILIGGISENLYKFASNDNKFYMEQDLNRIKLVLVEKKKTGKWLAQELGVSECTVSRWASNKAQPNLSSLNVIAKLLGVEMKDLLRS